MFDVDALYVALDRQRRAGRLRWREIAHEIGVSASVFSRMAKGGRPDVDSLTRMLWWLGDTDLAPYVREAT